MKKLFIIFNFLTLCLISNASNENNYNAFKSFNIRMSQSVGEYRYDILGYSGTENTFTPTLTVGNYLAFYPSNRGGINLVEFFSDVLKRDYVIIEIDKKGKEKNITNTIKYHPNNFFNNFMTDTSSNSAFQKRFGMTATEVKKLSSNTYKISLYPIQHTYLKVVNETSLIFSQNDKFNSKKDYHIFIENGKVVVRDSDGDFRYSYYKKGDSLIIDNKYSGLGEIRVNKTLSQFEYYSKGKLVRTEKYKLL